MGYDVMACKLLAFYYSTESPILLASDTIVTRVCGHKLSGYRLTDKTTPRTSDRIVKMEVGGRDFL